MHFKSIPLFLIVASLASTSLGLHPLVVTGRRSLELILSRQTNTPCVTICTNVQNTFGNCTTVGCICTVSNADNVQSCVNCAIQTDPSVSIVSSAQSLIDTFEGQCASVAGVPTVTIATGTAVGSVSATIAGSSVPLVASLSSSPALATTIIPATTVSQVVIGPSSASSAGTAGATATGSSSTNSASPNKVVLHWAGALFGLAAWNLLVF